MTTEDLSLLYQNRFGDIASSRRQAIWWEICRFFQREGFVRPSDAVLDLGSGYGEFINNVEAHEKAGIDLNKDAQGYLNPGIAFHRHDVRRLDEVFEPETFDLCFTSNFLEHLPSKDDVSSVLEQSHRILKSGGRFLLVGPNIRYVGGAYWDFFDHHMPLTEVSLCEALVLAGFQPKVVFGRFLPYTMKQKLPSHPLLVRAYLRCRPAWRVLGKQFLVLAEKRSTARPRRERSPEAAASAPSRAAG